MAKVTSKLQLTIPKAIADQYRIRPGDELEWTPAGDTIRVTLPGKKSSKTQQFSTMERVHLFDQATERQRRREIAAGKKTGSNPTERGWTREDAYARDSH